MNDYYSTSVPCKTMCISVISNAEAHGAEPMLNLYQNPFAMLATHQPTTKQRCTRFASCLLRMVSHPGRSSFVCLLKPIIASQPCKERNQNANSNKEAKRYHPYPQPVSLVLFLQPRIGVSELWPRQMCMSMMCLGLGLCLRDRG